MILSSSPLIHDPIQFSLSISILLLFPSLFSPLLLLFFPTSLNLLPYLFLPLPPPPLTYTPLLFNFFPHPLVSLFLVLFSRYHFPIILSSCLRADRAMGVPTTGLLIPFLRRSEGR
jgi:hypothetical protein